MALLCYTYQLFKISHLQAEKCQPQRGLQTADSAQKIYIQK